MLGRVLNLKWYTQKEYRKIDYVILLTVAFITSELCNQWLDYVGMIHTGEFPIQTLMFDGKELMFNSK